MRALLSGAGVRVLATSNEAAVLVTDDAGLGTLTAEELTGVVVLSDAPPWAGEDLSPPAGGWAWLPPDCPPEWLVAGVYAAAAGLTCLPARWAGLLTPPGDPERPHDLSDDLLGDLPAAVDRVSLTPREHEVLGLLALGLSNKQAARQLGVSDHTVKFHVAALSGKLGVSTRTAAVTRAIGLGLLTV